MKAKNQEEIIKVSAHGQITVPTELRKKLHIKENSLVSIRPSGKGCFIIPVEVKISQSSKSSSLDNMESDPLFAAFINAIGINAMEHPEKLRDPADAWDPDVVDLLKRLPDDDEE